MSKSIVPDIIKNSKVLLDLEVSVKEEALKKLVHSFDIDSEQKQLLYNSVLQREEMGSTGIGNGIAIPHTRSLVVTDIMVAIGRPSKPIEFNAIDGKSVNLIFLIVAPPYDSKNEYLILLGKISEAFIEISKNKNLLKIKNEKDFKEQLCNLFEDNNG